MTANVGNSFERTSCLLSFFLKIAFIFLLASECAICCSFYTIFSLLLAPAKSIESTMSGIPNLKDLVFRDTPFANLMNKRIYNVVLIATKYDAFMLEDDGRVDHFFFFFDPYLFDYFKETKDSTLRQLMARVSPNDNPIVVKVDMRAW